VRGDAVMWLENKRLVIRDLKSEDKDAFVEIALDGSLHDIFENYDDYHKLMENWIKESSSVRYRK